MRYYRKEKVASVVRDIVSEVIARRLSDPRIAPLTTVTRVEMSGDLAIARVFLAIQGESAVERRTLAAMQHACGYVQRFVGRELGIRQCPELRFEVDESVKIARQTMELLEENRQQRARRSSSEGEGRTVAEDADEEVSADEAGG